MPALQYVGKPVTANPDVVYRDYVTTVKNADLTSDAIDQAINGGLGAYASVSYVDTRDGLLATQTYIDAQDNLRLKLSQKSVANGIAALDATTKVPQQLINGPLNQKFFRGPWSPVGYGATRTFTTETTILSFTITDPGFPYKLLVFGTLDTTDSLDNEYAQFLVRVGNATTGEIIAIGNGAADAPATYVRMDDFNRSASDLGPDWEEIYTEGGSGNGAYLPTGAAVYWGDNGNTPRTLKAFRVNANDRYTGTNFQRIEATLAAPGENRADGTNYQYFRLYGRVNDARTQYVTWQITELDAKLFYNIGSGEVQLGSTYSVTPAGGSGFVMFCGDPISGAPRKYALYHNSGLVGLTDDTTAITSMSPTNRGWGFGVRATTGFFGFGQTTPPALDSVGGGDWMPAYKPTIIVPKMGMTTRTGTSTIILRGLRSGASSNAGFQSYRPKLHVMAVPA